MIRLRLALLILAIACTPYRAGPANSAPAPADAERFCIVPIEDSATKAGYLWRLVAHVYQIPGLPGPVFTPDGGKPRTIDSERRLVRYEGPFPTSYLDLTHWVQEPWSSRVVATKEISVFTLKPGSGSFVPIDTSAVPERIWLWGPFVFPRRHLTVVLSRIGPFVVEGNGLRPWMSAEKMAELGVPYISRMYDAPSLSATIVRAEGGRVFVLSDDDSWHQVAKLSERDLGTVFDVPASAAAVFVTADYALVIRREERPDGARFSAERMVPYGQRYAYSAFIRSSLFGQVLRFGRNGFFDRGPRWQRLGDAGFEDIPGGDIGIGTPDVFPNGRIVESRSLGRVVIYGHYGLFLYDGRGILRVTGSSDARLGHLPQVYDFPSIGKTLVSASTGLFEITEEARLVELDMPFPTQGYPRVQLADWPEAEAALVATQAGIIALDRDLTPMRVQGGDKIVPESLPFDVGPVAASGSRVLRGKTSLFLAVDRLSAGRATCDEAAR